MLAITFLMMLAAAVLTGAQTPEPQVSYTAPRCRNCMNRGEKIYQGEYTCLCRCNKAVGLTEDGQNGTIRFLPPDCRFSQSQSTSVATAVNIFPNDFVFSVWVQPLVETLAVDLLLAEIRLISVVNLTTSIIVRFDIRDESEPVGGIAPSMRTYMNLKQAFQQNQPWVLNTMAVTSVDQLAAEEGPVFTIMKIGELQGFQLPLEGCLVLAGYILTTFVMYAAEIIMSDNFIADEDAAREDLNKYRKKKRAEAPRTGKELWGRAAAKVGMEDAPVVTAAAEAAGEAPDAWLSGLDEGYKAPEEEVVQRKGTRSLADFANKFYKNT